MTRYISADDFLDLFYVSSAGQDKAFIETVEMVVADTPTADVVEVVRCANCVYHTVFANRDMCTKHAVFWGSRETGLRETKPDHFCSYGERRNDAAD